MSLNRVKRAVLRPVTAWRRWRVGPVGPHKRALLESNDYRPAMQRFLATARDNPDLLFDVDFRDGAVAIDVGAYEGAWSAHVLERATRQGRDIAVHAYEPAAAQMKTFTDTVGRDTRVALHGFGLGARDRTELLALGGPGSSLYRDPDRDGFMGASRIEIRDAARELDSLAVERIDVMMLNIEGGEYELLDRLHETGWLARIGTVFVQFHDFAPGAYRGRRRNRKQLAATHGCTWSFPWVYDRWDAICERPARPAGRVGLDDTR